MVLLNTFLAIESSTIPLQLLQFPRSPFFRSLKRFPVCQSSGNLSFSQMVWKSQLKHTNFPAFNISTHIRSSPGASPFFKVSIALLISSCVVGGSTLTSISSNASDISAIISGSWQFKMDLKCSVHRSTCFLSLVMTLSFTSFTGLSLLRKLSTWASLSAW